MPILRKVVITLTAGLLCALPACGIGYGRPTNVADLDTGRCTMGDLDIWTRAVTVVPCSGPHRDEVFAARRVPGDTYPGGDVLEQQADRLCAGSAFTTYIGRGWDESELWMIPWPPDRNAWADGERTIFCLVAAPDGAVLTGSVRGSKR